MTAEILYEDEYIIVAIKPRGVSSQSNMGFEEDMVSILKKHIGGGYIGVIHRLDKPVYGLMVYGKNKIATALLSEELRNREIEKAYEALVEGIPHEKEGCFKDFIVQEKNGKNSISRCCDKSTQGAKEAVLNYKSISSEDNNGIFISRLRIKLLTGRHHQIRLQCAAHGLPLLGDYKYNKRLSKRKCEYDRVLALAAVELKFNHPVNKTKMEYKINADF